MNNTADFPKENPVNGVTARGPTVPLPTSPQCLVDRESLNQELEYLWDDCAQSGKTYEMYLGKISRTPIVKSKTTGKYFALPWSLIINLAVEQGVDK